MTGIPPFSSVPGQLYPGEGQPALVATGGGGSGYFQYYGHMVLYYLDYLNAGTQETLVAVPGGSYLMTIVNSRHGLTIPPPDGRWDPHTVRDFVVFHPRGSAAWDREMHFRQPPGVVRGQNLSEARAAIGPGLVPPVLVPLQRDVIHVRHDPRSAAWDRTAHATLRPSVAPGPSLAEVRVRIEAAKAARGFWDTGPAVSEPVPVAAGRVMPAPEPSELQRVRAALAARAAAV